MGQHLFLNNMALETSIRSQESVFIPFPPIVCVYSISQLDIFNYTVSQFRFSHSPKKIYVIFIDFLS